jgi:hypothetical protein
MRFIAGTSHRAFFVLSPFDDQAIEYTSFLNDALSIGTTKKKRRKKQITINLRQP